MRFYHRLALALGKTVAELLGSLDSEELTDWMAFASLEPIGEERADLRAGIIASAVANSRPWLTDPLTPSDFMPDYDAAEPADLPPEEVERRVHDTLSILAARLKPAAPAAPAR